MSEQMRPQNILVSLENFLTGSFPLRLADVLLFAVSKAADFLAGAKYTCGRRTVLTTVLLIIYRLPVPVLRYFISLPAE